jgi:GWxTD domain-containing protein
MLRKLVVVGLMVVSSALVASAGTVGIPVPGISDLPAEWLLTPAERSEIAKLKTPEEAKNYVALFWARRDPTPGTPHNEFRDVFEARVLAADKYFTQGTVQGSKSDRGKVYILLGPPSNLTSKGDEFDERSNLAGAGGTEGLSSTNRVQAGRDKWDYTGTDATRLGVHDFDVLFIKDTRGVYRRDPSKVMVVAAMDNAAKSLMRNPDLKAVPEWAKPVAPAPESVKVTRVIVDTPKVIPPPPAELQGANTFVLSKSVSTFAPQKSANPFTSLSTVSSFTQNDDLGYAFQYCAESADPDALPPLKVQITISGTSKGEKVNMNAPAEEALPEALKAMPGCYMIRGSIPLSDIAPGTYTIKVGVEGAKQPYNFSQTFKVE